MFRLMKYLFKLTFGAEAVIPLEIGLVSNWIKEYNENTNHEWFQTSLDLLEEIREKAHIRMVTYK